MCLIVFFLFWGGVPPQFSSSKPRGTPEQKIGLSPGQKSESWGPLNGRWMNAMDKKPCAETTPPAPKPSTPPPNTPPPSTTPPPPPQKTKTHRKSNRSQKNTPPPPGERILGSKSAPGAAPLPGGGPVAFGGAGGADGLLLGVEARHRPNSGGDFQRRAIDICNSLGRGCGWETLFYSRYFCLLEFGCQNRFGIPVWLVGEFAARFRTDFKWGLGCSLKKGF